MQNAEPIDLEEAAFYLGLTLAPDEPVALAVSGGPDSMALAYLVHELGLPCKAYIVEHGLREESAEEAKTVQARLKDLGIEAEILSWEHEEVKSRVHVLARTARFSLLIEACKRDGFSKLLLAHHKDDQAETVLMRFAKGSGVEGLAGMREEMMHDDILFLRPFLSLAKERLIATCETNRVPYVIDPSNDSAKYARGRLRAARNVLAEEGMTTDTLCEVAVRAREASEAITYYAEKFLQENLSQNDFGVLSLPAESFLENPQAVLLKILDRLLRFLVPAAYPHERAQLLTLLQDLQNSEEEARTLGGVLIQRRGADFIFLRESAAITEEIEVVAGDDVLWDNRFHVKSSQKGTLRKLGFQEKETLDARDASFRKKCPRGRVRASLPGVFAGEELIELPKMRVLSFKDNL